MLSVSIVRRVDDARLMQHMTLFYLVKAIRRHGRLSCGVAPLAVPPMGRLVEKYKNGIASQDQFRTLRQ